MSGMRGPFGRFTNFAGPDHRSNTSKWSLPRRAKLVFGPDHRSNTSKWSLPRRLIVVFGTPGASAPGGMERGEVRARTTPRRPSGRLCLGGCGRLRSGRPCLDEQSSSSVRPSFGRTLSEMLRISSIRPSHGLPLENLLRSFPKTPPPARIWPEPNSGEGARGAPESEGGGITPTVSG